MPSEGKLTRASIGFDLKFYYFKVRKISMPSWNGRKQREADSLHHSGLDHHRLEWNHMEDLFVIRKNQLINLRSREFQIIEGKI
jgi:hypothetical protein